MSDEKLLKEYVKSIITEDDGGFGGFGGDMGGMYGMDFTGGDQSRLAKVFITPFTDVLKTAAGKGKEISTKAQTVAKVAFEALATTLIPVLASDYNSIFADEKQQIEKLRSQYKDVYDRTWTAIKDNDVLSAAFMYAPAAMITATVARKAPVPVLDTISILSGGKLDGFVSKVKKKLQLGDEKKMDDKDSGSFEEAFIAVGGTLILEKSKKKQADVGKILTQKGVVSALQSSPIVQRMQASGQAAIRGTLEKLFDRMRDIQSAKSVQELGSKLGKQIPGVEKLQQIPEQERAQMEQALLQSAKEGAKKLYISQLQATVQGAVKAGVPEDHPMVRDYQTAIAKIKGI